MSTESIPGKGGRSREYLRRKLLGARGGTHYSKRTTLLLSKLNGPEVDALHDLIKSIEEDANMDGRRRGQRDAMAGRFR